MKARVKETGEIVEVNEFCTLRDSGERTYYWINALELITKENPDYWTRLEHQYAGMAMQGMLNNSYLAGEFRKGPNNGIEDMPKIITKAAAVYAHALAEKMKEVK